MVEAVDCEAVWDLEEANGDGPDIRNGDLRELSRRRERRGVDAIRELLFAEVEVLHEIDGRQDRGAYADLGDVLFDLVLAVEVRVCRLAEPAEVKTRCTTKPVSLSPPKFRGQRKS